MFILVFKENMVVIKEASMISNHRVRIKEVPEPGCDGGNRRAKYSTLNVLQDSREHLDPVSQLSLGP